MSEMKRPYWTLAICCMAALSYYVPALHQALLFDRAAINAGAWWRVPSGNLLHFSTGHLYTDVLTVLIAGSLIETRGTHGMGAFYLLTAGVVGLTVYFYHPELRYYGGLSGIATATLVYLGLDGLKQNGRSRIIHVILLFGITLKLISENCLGAVWLTGQSYTPVPVAHLAGALCAWAYFQYLHITPTANILHRLRGKYSASTIPTVHPKILGK